MVRFSLNPVTLEILDGDIAAQDVDAVVNAANNHFWMGAGVAGALKARGGETIQTEAMALGPVEPGDAVVTSGGALCARTVIHAAVVGQDLRTSAAIIARATARALALADERGFESVAFPAFGTGVGGLPVRGCAQIMIDVIGEHHPRSIRTIRLVLFGQPAYRTFVEVAADRIGPAAHADPDCPLST